MKIDYYKNMILLFVANLLKTSVIANPGFLNKKDGDIGSITFTPEQFVASIGRGTCPESNHLNPVKGVMSKLFPSNDDKNFTYFGLVFSMVDSGEISVSFKDCAELSDSVLAGVRETITAAVKGRLKTCITENSFQEKFVDVFVKKSNSVTYSGGIKANTDEYDFQRFENLLKKFILLFQVELKYRIVQDYNEDICLIDDEFVDSKVFNSLNLPARTIIAPIVGLIGAFKSLKEVAKSVNDRYSTSFDEYSIRNFLMLNLSHLEQTGYTVIGDCVVKNKPELPNDVKAITVQDLNAILQVNSGCIKMANLLVTLNAVRTCTVTETEVTEFISKHAQHIAIEEYSSDSSKLQKNRVVFFKKS